MQDFSILTPQPSLFPYGMRIDLNCRGFLGRGSGWAMGNSCVKGAGTDFLVKVYCSMR